MDRLPVIYVRGYAGTTAGIDAQVDDPFYGFNRGSTHVRVDGDGDPSYYQFEGPMLRLMIDEKYQLLVNGDQGRYLELARRTASSRRSRSGSTGSMTRPRRRSWPRRTRTSSSASSTRRSRRSPSKGFNIETAAGVSMT